MVSPGCFPLSEERRGSSYSYTGSQGSNMSDRDGGEASQQRKRIAVACGRCRKRKIRCSGDNGTGQPCTNCRNAGHDPCQFLRVSSQETPMRVEGGFTYGIDASRQFHARGSSSMMPPLTQPIGSPYVEGMQIPGSDHLQYRNGSSYGYTSKQYYPMQGFNNGYSEEHGVDYNLYPSSYQSVQDPSYMLNYRLGSNNPAKPSTSMYVDSDSAAYGYGSGSGSGSALAHRSTSNPDSGCFSFQNVAAGLSNSLSSTERSLPAPSRRPLPSSAPRPYRADSLSSIYSRNSQHSNGGTSPPSPVPEGHGGYSGFDGSPAASYHATSMSSQLSRSSDLYTTSPSDTMLQGSDSSVRLPGGGHELTYRYHDTTLRRNSTSLPGSMGIGGSQPYPHQSHGQNTSFLMGGDIGTAAGADHGAADERKPLVGLRS